MFNAYVLPNLKYNDTPVTVMSATYLDVHLKIDDEDRSRIVITTKNEFQLPNCELTISI